MHLSGLHSARNRRQYECLYIHIPFCTEKCDYCSFYSVSGSTVAQRSSFHHRLEEELAEAGGDLQNLRTIFIGGGTPSLLEHREMTLLFDLISRYCRLRPGGEFTVECNPESLTVAKIELMTSNGVNRISLGVQTFSPRLRRTLGRAGSVDRISFLTAGLRQAGIDNIGIDLIYNIPGQTIPDWHHDLETSLALGISHLSTYELTREEGTVPADRARQIPADAEIAVEMWHTAEEYGHKHGFERYEVANFSRRGCTCRHNQAIWHGATYLGCGPAAVSFNGYDRWMNPSDLNKWLHREPATVDRLPAESRAAEILAFGMRTVSGWSRAQFQARTGFDFWLLRGPRLTALAEEKLVAIDGSRIRPTLRGLLFADYIIERLL